MLKVNINTFWRTAVESSMERVLRILQEENAANQRNSKQRKADKSNSHSINTFSDLENYWMTDL